MFVPVWFRSPLANETASLAIYLGTLIADFMKRPKFMGGVIFELAGLLSAGRCFADCVQQGLDHRKSEVGCRRLLFTAVKTVLTSV